MASEQDRITPPDVYFNRRKFIRGSLIAGSALATAAIYKGLNFSSGVSSTQPMLPGLDLKLSENAARTERGFLTREELTEEYDILTYNNFYEFTTKKTDVAAAARNFSTENWNIQVDGLVHSPQNFTMTDIEDLARPEERVYRMRCVEIWSMVIPWAGIPLSALIEKVQPKANAKFVSFYTLHDPKRMPGQKWPVIDWPYREALRLDEAMHPLTFLATGLYRRKLPPQDGAPIRLVVPWKYGFKGIKSIVRISFTESQPETSWNMQAPDEYGFYANVNPEVDHPRWSQRRERRIGENRMIKTKLFNGYDQVADLYRDLDLTSNF